MRNLRTKRIVVRLSTEEHEALSAKAKAAGMTLTALVRDHAGRVRVHNHADREAWLRAVLALNNSAATFARASIGLNPADAVVALAYIASIHRRLDELVKQFPAHDREIFQARSRQG